MNKDHIDNSLSKIRILFEKASDRIDAIPNGGKIPATKLAEEIGNEVGITGATLYPVLKFLFEGYPGVEIKRGAKGGIVKTMPKTEPVVSVKPDKVDSTITDAI